jgi:UDP-glucuronate 4-epimerase
MARILITGGAGFIGSHVAQRLLSRGDDVAILDNFDGFYPAAQKRRNVELVREAAAAGGRRCELLEGDIRDAPTCAKAVAGVDAVVHAAALAGVRPSIADPARYLDVNVTGTQVLLDAVGARPGLRFVFASSSSVYGGNTKVPFAEHDPVDRPISPYAASKKAGELICYTFHHLRGHPVTCLRFFTVYGPGQRPEMAIHLFSRRICAGEEIPVFGDGSSRRDYTYVDDVVDGVLAAVDRSDGFRVYNLGGSRTTTLTDLITMLQVALGKQARIRSLPAQPGDVEQTWADVSLAARELGYAPRVSIEDGLRRFAQWYLAERAAGRVA